MQFFRQLCLICLGLFALPFSGYAQSASLDPTQDLNGCQIAYGFVYHGINASSTGYQPFGEVPDEAISWALKYEDANLKNKACPEMPIELSNWVERQPISQFRPAKDPYTWFRQRKGPYADTQAGWQHFSSIWMSRYKTVDVLEGNDFTTCMKVAYYMQGKRRSDAPAKSGTTALWQLFQIAGKNPMGQSWACSVVPPEVIGPAKAKWAKEVRAAAEAERLRSNPPPRQFVYTPPRTNADNYLWPRQPTTRCYWAGDTKYGSKQVCFTN